MKHYLKEIMGLLIITVCGIVPAILYAISIKDKETLNIKYHNIVNKSLNDSIKNDELIINLNKKIEILEIDIKKRDSVINQINYQIDSVSDENTILKSNHIKLLNKHNNILRKIIRRYETFKQNG